MIDIKADKVLIKSIAAAIETDFRHQLEGKGLVLEINVDDNIPLTIVTDTKRLIQIIKNLMSNAIKFTEKGKIIVAFKPVPGDNKLLMGELDPDSAIMISISDTGIGIPAEKHNIIFEAFKQAEGGTSREYGGTGLGLSISREMASLLGGEIQLKSEVGEGSTFMLIIPLELKDNQLMKGSRVKGQVQGTGYERAIQRVETVPDDRDGLNKEDKVMLVIEDDSSFAEIMKTQCHERGFKCLLSSTGGDGLALAEKYLPAGIILDINLPDIDGYTVLDTLKSNFRTRHIPVHIISIHDDNISGTASAYTVGYLRKPASKEELDGALGRIEAVLNKKVSDLLVIEDDKYQRENIVQLIGNNDVKVTEAVDGKEAVAKLKSGKYECVVLDFLLPDMTGLQLLEKLQLEKVTLPSHIIVYTVKDLTREECDKLHKYVDSIIIKGGKSEERLLDETALFLHRIVSGLPQRKQEMIKRFYDKDSPFKDKKVLIVEDDMRSAFSLSEILRENGMKTVNAEDGRKALDILSREPDIDIVLMDIMMPVMDGYETMRKIRVQKGFRKLPIIAVTAKAMQEDRDKCIDAGASDYITKPVNTDRLLSVMRIWMYK
jgi:CheY-like chemotaxis protein/two-component sensor histidine kinase